jgi:hypothetical protein
MPSRTQALNAIKVGDVIFGLGAGGQEKLLLVYRADSSSFSARHVTTQMTFRFGRDGRTRTYADGGYIEIVSTARLPADQYDVTLGLDRKSAARPDYPDSILSKAEITLLLTHPKFFKAQLLPGAEAIVRAADKLNGVNAILHREWDPIDARDNPPGLREYRDDLPALVALLEQPASLDGVAAFLSDMAVRKGRTRAVADRSQAAAASLVQLRESWV